MVLLPMGALRRSVSPGFRRCGGDVRGFAGCSDAGSPTKWSDFDDQGAPMRHAQLMEVCDMSDVVLGIGGFGAVRRARHKASGLDCAVKTVSKRNALASSWARREAEIMRSLKHAYICKLLDAFEDDNNVYLVLELVRGADLCARLDNEVKLDESCAADIMRQVFEALAYCHSPEISVLHRDLKPENIMLQAASENEAPAVKLIDFGLATRCADQVLRADVVGTAEFLAPEARAKGAYSRASDMWSAGVVLHMLLTGGVLPTEAHVLKQCDLSESAAELVRSLLSEEPSDRPSATEAARHPWILGQLPADDRSDRTARRFRRGGA